MALHLVVVNACHSNTMSQSILFGTRQRLRNFPLVSIPTIAGSKIPFSDNIKTLDVTRC